VERLVIAALRGCLLIRLAADAGHLRPALLSVAVRRQAARFDQAAHPMVFEDAAEARPSKIEFASELRRVV
jgi:hypothetical protein